MRTRAALPLGMLLALLAVAAAAIVYVRVTQLTTRAVPGAVETAVARAARRLAIPGDAKQMRNPVPPSAAALGDGMSHFADHCAGCHANNGSGETEMGRGFYPPAPDMRSASTQNLSDGELFYIIENGLRFTGMPAWGTGSAAGEESSWQLVHFIRHLPALTDEEIERMKAVNPRSPDAIREDIEAEKFLKGVQ